MIDKSANDPSSKLEWICVYASDQHHKASLIITLLNDEGLNAVLLNKRDLYNLFGSYEVHTPQDQAMEARMLVAKAQSI